MGSEESKLKEHGYTQVKEVGQGAALVQDTRDKNQYISKIINLEKMSSKNKRKTKMELAVLANLKHRHIVKYKESFEHEDLHIVMEYCQGGNLAESIAEKRQQDETFSEEEILQWFTQICLALKCVHDKNVLHRDIKPQNIFLTYDETIKLGDFGVSKDFCRKEEYAKFKPEIPFYVAPEVWKCECFDKKSDIWALGCVLYELCTLKSAFVPKEHLLFIFELWNQPPPPISENFSTELRSLVDELLQKDPRNRPSIDEVLQKPLLAKYTQHVSPKLMEDKSKTLVCSSDTTECLTKEVSLLSENIEHFLAVYHKEADKIQKLIDELKKTADDLERVHYGTTVGSLAGGVVGAAGGITSIVGLILAPFTLGASLIVTGVGIGVAVAGGAAGAASNITNMVNQSSDRSNIERIINEYRERMEPLLFSVDNIQLNVESIKRFTDCDSHDDIKIAISKSMRGLGGVAELGRLVQVLSIGRVAAQAARGARVAAAVTGVLSGLFLALDVIFIAKDSKEIHNIRNATSNTKVSADEVKSATLKIVLNTRKMAEQFQDVLNEMEQTVAGMEESMNS